MFQYDATENGKNADSCACNVGSNLLVMSKTCVEINGNVLAAIVCA